MVLWIIWFSRCGFKTSCKHCISLSTDNDDFKLIIVNLVLTPWYFSKANISYLYDVSIALKWRIFCSRRDIYEETTLSIACFRRICPSGIVYFLEVNGGYAVVNVMNLCFIVVRTSLEKHILLFYSRWTSGFHIGIWF